jgi:hypothetical protein
MASNIAWSFERGNITTVAKVIRDRKLLRWIGNLRGREKKRGYHEGREVT